MNLARVSTADDRAVVTAGPEPLSPVQACRTSGVKYL